jgi:hypothetical protein
MATVEVVKTGNSSADALFEGLESDMEVSQTSLFLTCMYTCCSTS